MLFPRDHDKSQWPPDHKAVILSVISGWANIGFEEWSYKMLTLHSNQYKKEYGLVLLILIVKWLMGSTRSMVLCK